MVGEDLHRDEGSSDTETDSDGTDLQRRVAPAPPPQLASRVRALSPHRAAPPGTEAAAQARPEPPQDEVPEWMEPRAAGKNPLPPRDWGVSLLGCLAEPIHSAACCVSALLVCGCCGLGPAFTFGRTRLLLDEARHHAHLEAVPRRVEDSILTPKAALQLCSRVSADTRLVCVEGCLFCLACCACVSCTWGCTNRTRLRARYGIGGSLWSDVVAHCCCCQPCALIQEYRFVKASGPAPEGFQVGMPWATPHQAPPEHQNKFT